MSSSKQNTSSQKKRTSFENVPIRKSLLLSNKEVSTKVSSKSNTTQNSTSSKKVGRKVSKKKTTSILNNNEEVVIDSEQQKMEVRETSTKESEVKIINELNEKNKVVETIPDESVIPREQVVMPHNNIVHKNIPTPHKDPHHNHVVHKDKHHDNVSNKNEHTPHKDTHNDTVLHKDKHNDNVVNKDPHHNHVVHKDKHNDTVVHKDKHNDNVAHKNDHTLHKDTHHDVVHKDKHHDPVVHKDKHHDPVVHKDKHNDNVHKVKPHDHVVHKSDHNVHKTKHNDRSLKESKVMKSFPNNKTNKDSPPKESSSINSEDSSTVKSEQDDEEESVTNDGENKSDSKDPNESTDELNNDDHVVDSQHDESVVIEPVDSNPNEVMQHEVDLKTDTVAKDNNISILTEEVELESRYDSNVLNNSIVSPDNQMQTPKEQISTLEIENAPTNPNDNNDNDNNNNDNNNNNNNVNESPMVTKQITPNSSKRPNTTSASSGSSRFSSPLRPFTSDSVKDGIRKITSWFGGSAHPSPSPSVKSPLKADSPNVSSPNSSKKPDVPLYAVDEVEGSVKNQDLVVDEVPKELPSNKEVLPVNDPIIEIEQIKESKPILTVQEKEVLRQKQRIAADFILWAVITIQRVGRGRIGRDRFKRVRREGEVCIDIIMVLILWIIINTG